MADYEYCFDPGAKNNTAAAVYRLARTGGKRVLDLGSGPGIVAGVLGERDDKLVTCIDSSRDALESARGRGVSRTIRADLGDADWVRLLDGESFDVIVMADVLEHLVDPAIVLKTINGAALLAGDGHLVVSIPNAGHEAVLAELINGRFTYQDTGLLDSTHLRFFTLASLRELLEQHGFFITQIERTRRTAEQTSLAIHDVGLPDELRDRVLEASPEAQTYQFVVRAERADASRELAELRERLQTTQAALAEQERVSVRDAVADAETVRDEAVARVAELETEVAESLRDRAVLERRVAELEGALERERKLTATERKRQEQALAKARQNIDTEQAEAAQRKIARLEKKLDDVYSSNTWKVGRVAWSAVHLPARMLRRRKKTPAAPVSTKGKRPEPVVAVIDYQLVDNNVVRAKYEEALAKRVFTSETNRVAIAVYTDDLDAGRGDLYTAVGLGRNLEEIGYEVIYLPQERWYDVPAGTDAYVAMLETVDVTRLPSDLTTVAWVRNQTAVWAEQPWLPLLDLVLASSQQSLEVLARVYPGPTGLLPIGVDTELFSAPASPAERNGVVSTVNQWGREREVLAFLKEKELAFPLALYGQQRGIAPQLEPYGRGSVSFFSLPSLYGQARIVLDDFNHTTAGFGNVNSRLFEAAACGAIVLTNRAVGLGGLEDVPVYSSAAELFDLIDRGLESSDALKTAEKLQEAVLEKHSYRKRAADFDRLLKGLDQPCAPTDAPVLSYYPDYRDNPYTEMMWSELRSRGGIAIPVDNTLDFTATIRAAEHRPTVFHLNWTAPILGGAADDHDRLVRHRRFLEALDEMHANGIPSIWTVHNVLPHECADPELEAQLRQEIADRVDVIHVMCEETIAACAEWFELPESKVRVIPHPSYIDVYPNLVDRETAREALGLGPDDFVYLHFGQVRPYKGIGRLLDAFERISIGDPKAKLVLVGKPGRFEGVRQIVDRARANPNVIGNFNPVPDSDVQLYMNASDAVVLPHQKALNSGALLLAYSFARLVISPDTGCLKGLVDDTTGISFDPNGGVLALQNAMLSARSLTPSHGKTAYERASRSHYLDIGKRFAETVDEVLP